MNRTDLIRMALHNLWARKWSTVFNILGIVISCSMLLLVFAGTRGAHDGLLNLFAESDLAKQFSIRPGRNFNSQPKTPKAKHDMPGKGIAEDRVTRIREKLDKEWESKNYPMARLTLDKLTELRKLPEIAAVIPIQAMVTQLTLGDQVVPARAICMADNNSKLADRMVIGQTPQGSADIGKIWIDEYRAWRMGFKTDQQLEDLIGQTVKLRFQVASATLSPGIKRFAAAFGVSGIDETEQIADTFRKLFADLDETSLDEIEKEIIRVAAEKLRLDSGFSIATAKDGAPFVYREFEIAGIVKPAQASASSIFQITASSPTDDLLIGWRDYQVIEKATQPHRSYRYCVGSVHDSDDLRTAIELVEASGLRTRSALEIIDKADAQLERVRLIVAAIAMVILLIASVGIMNTVVIAVMERTPEFGIMKAIGATDSDIRWLMLVEAALTGLLGAIVSIGVAFLIDAAVSEYTRQFIETKLRHDFDFKIFVYSGYDMLLVCSIGVGICMLSSLLPSRRAAKLDPVIAMK